MEPLEEVNILWGVNTFSSCTVSVVDENLIEHLNIRCAL